MKILVIGGGSIGARHIKNLLELDKEVEIGVYDPGLVAPPVTSGRVHIVPDLQDRWDASLICSPSHLHYEQMSWSISRHIPCFVEKPFCLPNQVSMSRRDIRTSWSDSIPIMVGYNLYYHPFFLLVEGILRSRDLGDVLSYVGRYSHYLPYWRGDKDSYSRHREQGGGVLLDCIQDIDLMLELTGDWVGRSTIVAHGRVGSVTKDSEDTALVWFRSPSKVATLQLDYLRHQRIRQIEVSCERGTVVWSSTRYRPSKEDNGSETLDVFREGGYGVHKVGVAYDLLDGSYYEEMRQFLLWVKDGVAPHPAPNPFRDPFRALDLLRQETDLWKST